jgi:hypothetical protein
MLKFLLNPLLVKEAELDRPPDGWPERIFRFSVYYFCTSAVCIAILLRFWDWETITTSGGLPASIARGIVGPCLIYMVNYMVWRFVDSQLIKTLWWTLMIFLVIMILILSIVT